jgi:uncharacterized protein
VEAHVIRILLASLLLVPVVAAAQPSFDCGKASTSVERAICGDAKLAAVDRELASTYDGLLAKLSGPAKDHLVKDQARWLENRGASCTANLAGCLVFRYRQRLATLKAEGEGAYPFVSEQQVRQSGKVKTVRYEIDARYPQFDGGADYAALNKAFADTARAGAKDAVPAQDIDGGREQSWTYEQSFALFRPGPQAVSVRTTSYIFTGGAHGGTTIAATLVDLRSGRAVKPSEVLQGDWRRTVSEIARADLKRQFAERPGFEDALQSGKFDKLMNDDGRFLFRDGALELIVNQYEVGPYAAGQYFVTIPYGHLTPVIRPDWLVQFTLVGAGRGSR